MTDSKDIQNPHRFMHPMASHLLTCGFTGILAEIIYYPFLTIWTTQNSKNLSFRKACSAIKRGNGFYAGFSLSLKSVIPIAALYLLGKDLPLKLGDNAVTHCLQGFAGQGLSTLCYEPAIKLMMLAQTAKTKEKTDPFNQLSIIKKIHTLLLKEGLRGLYGAAIPGYLAHATSDAIGYCLLAIVKKNYSEITAANNSALYLLTAVMCFALSAAATAPLDLVATNIRIGKFSPNLNSRGVARKVYASGGTRALFHGTVSCMLYRGLWGGVMVVSEEIVKAKITSSARP